MPRTLGPYELRRPLGQGGMAEVFLARRRISGSVEKQLVVKRIRRERASDPRFVAMFVQEARLSMLLAHKNIVPVFDFGRVGDELFLAMELVDGCDLGRMLDIAREQGQLLDPMLVAYIAMEACQALDYAHGASDMDGTPRGLVHRDVTPRNVLVSRAGEVKLVDFGLAVSVAEAGAGTIRGTPAYMSPEQAHGWPVDGRADVFSLGLIVWEALAGHRAYDGRDSARMLTQAREARVPPLPDRVPEPLRRIVARATAAAPDERYAGARDMQIALDEYLVSARAAAGGAPPSHVLAAWLREHPIDVAGSAVQDSDGPDVSDLPDGPVATFLDHGENSVLEGVGQGTMRSLAETMDEIGPASASESASRSASASGSASASESKSVPASAPRRRLVALAGMSVALALAAILAATMSAARDPHARDLSATVSPGPIHTAPTTPTLVAVIPLPDAAPPTDAAPPPDAAPPSDPRLPPSQARHPRPSALPASPRATAAPADGVVKISATPWARVTVAGSDAACDETPCVLRLPAGRHTLQLVNPVAGLRTERTIDVTPGQPLVLRETWAR